MDDEKDLTPDEREQMDETGETPEEAHRAGEFDELRDMMARVLDELAAVRTDFAALNAKVPTSFADLVRSGAVVRDDEVADLPEGDNYVRIEDMDFTI